MSQNRIEIIKKEEMVQMEYYVSHKVFICGNKIYIKSIKTKRSINPTTVNVGNDLYCNRITGETKPKNKKTCRKVNMEVFFTIKRIIEANFCGGNNELFITLTYSCVMRDTEKFQKDFKAFWRKLHRKYPNCEFLRIAELHKNKGLHIHLLIKDMVNKSLFISTDELNEMWGNGSVNVKCIKSVEALANYFIPSKNASEKARNKFNLLKDYPAGFNIYSKSKGIYVPKSIEMNLEEIYELILNCQLAFAQIKDIILTDDEGNKRLINKIGYQEYVYNNVSVNRISKPELSGERKEVED